jgi:hypothetical protein
LAAAPTVDIGRQSQMSVKEERGNNARENDKRGVCGSDKYYVMVLNCSQYQEAAFANNFKSMIFNFNLPIVHLFLLLCTCKFCYDMHM